MYSYPFKYIHIYTYTCIYVYIYIHTYIYKYVCAMIGWVANCGLLNPQISMQQKRLLG